MTGSAIAHKTLINVIWSYTSFVATKVLNLVTLIILARLLNPSEFGLMAICVAVMAYFEIVAKFGLGAALISNNDEPEEMANAIFLFAMLSSAAMTALVWATAPFFARWFETPALVAPLRVIALTVVIDALSVVPTSLLQKNLRFKSKLVPDVARSLVKGITGIAMALAGYGVWALVLAHLAGTVVSVIATFWCYPWRPGAPPQWRHIRDALRFGSHLLLAELINAMQRNLDALLVGKLLGASALGVYSLAFRLPDLVIRSFNQVTGTVLHPVLSQINKDMAGLRVYYTASLRYVALFTFPAGVIIALCADPLVRVLYTPAWYGMIQPMQYLAIALALLTVDFVPGLVYKAINKPEYLLYVSLMKLPVFFGVLIFAARYGVEGVSLAQIGLSLFYILPNYLIVRAKIGVTLVETLHALWPATVVCLVAAVAGAALLAVVPGAPLVRLLAVAIGMGAAALGAMHVAAPETTRQIGKLFARRGRQSP